jgi:signal peptidase I
MKKRYIPLIVTTVLLVAALAVSVASFINLNDASRRQITSGSMLPSIPVGSVVYYTPVEQVAVGDVIVFYDTLADSDVTHRVVGIADDGSLLTQGDNNDTADVHYPPLTMSDVHGKVTHVVPGMIFEIVRLLPFVILALLAGIALWVWTGSDAPRRKTPAPRPV